jgi:hypothetical protein
MCNLHVLKTSKNLLGATFRMFDSRMEDVSTLSGRREWWGYGQA